MRYLFFDIECCDGAHICEFGYLLTDEAFRVIKRENILMDPEERFNFGGRREGREMHLTHTEEEYRRAPNFAAYHETIRQLLEEEEQYIIGFSMANDAKFLNTACEKYGLAKIEFKFYDVQRLLKILLGKQFSLENAAKELEIAVTEKLHESSEDSFLTMEIVRELCMRRNVSVEELFERSSLANSRDAFYRNDLNHSLSRLAERPSAFGKRQVNKIIGEFVKRVKPQGKVLESALTGKKVCFSPLYAKRAVKNFIVLIQMIADRGGKVCFKVSESDYYVRHEEDDETSAGSRYHYAKQVMQEGTLEILSLGEFLALLGIDEAELQAAPIPEVKEKERPSHIEEEHATYSLGDVLRTQNARKEEL